MIAVLSLVAVILGCLMITLLIVRQLATMNPLIRHIYIGESPPVIEGEVVSPDQAFFDEKDVAVMEAHEERPEFVKTTIDFNGVRVGPDGLPLDMEPHKRTFLERMRGD